MCIDYRLTTTVSGGTGRGGSERAEGQHLPAIGNTCKYSLASNLHQLSTPSTYNPAHCGLGIKLVSRARRVLHALGTCVLTRTRNGPPPQSQECVDARIASVELGVRWPAARELEPCGCQAGQRKLVQHPCIRIELARPIRRAASARPSTLIGFGAVRMRLRLGRAADVAGLSFQAVARPDYGGAKWMTLQRSACRADKSRLRHD